MSVSLLLLNSCVPLRKNNEYANDLKTMNKLDFSKKYFTLYNEDVVDFSRIKKNQAYYILRNGATFQYVVFSEDKYIYETPLMPLSMLGESFNPIKLNRSFYFMITNSIFKTEGIAATIGDIYPVIEEGEIKGDTISMKRKYNARGSKNEHKLFEEYVLSPKIKVYKMGDDYFLENKK